VNVDLNAVRQAIAIRAVDFGCEVEAGSIAVRTVTQDGWPLAAVAADLGEPESEVIVSGIAFDDGEIVLLPAMALARAFRAFDESAWPDADAVAELATVALAGPDPGVVADDPPPALTRNEHGGGITFRWHGPTGADQVEVLPDEWGNATVRFQSDT